MTWDELFLYVLTGIVCASANSDLETIDIRELNSSVYGTELFIWDNLYQKESSYRFEDFFWTGSGDEDTYITDDSWVIETPPTIYETKTVTTTVFTAATTTPQNETDTESTTACVQNCDKPTKSEGPITPTPTLIAETTTDDDIFINADRQFWILTVLKSDGKDPVIIDLKNSLTKLYKKAFQRQQDHHLGINRSRRKRKVAEKPVKVYIHNVDKQKQNGNEQFQVLYHVAVSGRPVMASTAVADVKLISDDEVREELGYPFLIKAEPYLKAETTQSLTKPQNTWMFIGVSILSLLVFLLVVAFLILGCTKRKGTPLAIENKKQIFERGVGGTIDKDLASSSHLRNRKFGDESPTYINFRNQPSNEPTRIGVLKKQSSYSPSSSSSTSLDISPLMTVKKPRTPPKKPPRPKAAMNKTVPINPKRIPPELFDSDSNGSSPDTIFVGNFDPGIVSPKSYLSMPSVKSFPRITNPEPLAKVLEPVSMLHLDMPDDEFDYNSGVKRMKPPLIRHGSLGTQEDPGVIGPVVWNMHYQELQHGMSIDEGMDELKTTTNVSRMRKRFHELLDDTFSLFGTRHGGSIEDTRPVTIEVKSHSAILNRFDEDTVPALRPRPKTSISQKSQSPSAKPRGAWASSAPSPLIRPMSAGPIIPRINVEQVLAEGKFRSNDPAISLIAAIKTELEKCSLPGSTTDLNK